MFSEVCQQFVNKCTLLIAIFITMCGAYHQLLNRFFKKILMRPHPCVFSQVLMGKILSPVLCSSPACEAVEQKKKDSHTCKKGGVLLRLVSK